MTQHLDDIELIRQFRERDHEVFEQLVAEYRDELVRHARRKLGDQGSAEDAVQETFLRAYRGSHRLRDDSRLRPWLHQILANVCIDEANRRQRQRFLTDKVERDPSAFMSYSIEEELRLDVDAGPVREALDSLPPTHQQALVMRFVDDLGYDEIASAAGTSEQNVRARVSRARTVLRAACRGAAAVPLLMAGAVRRGKSAAAAAEQTQAVGTVTKVEQATRAASVSVEGASGVSRMAASMAPAMETASTVALSAQSSAPTIGKAAAGLGALALAAMTTGSEAPQRIVAPPPIEIAAPTAAETETGADAQPAPQPEPVPEPVVAAPPPAAEPEPAPVAEVVRDVRLSTSLTIDESEGPAVTEAPAPPEPVATAPAPTTAPPAPPPVSEAPPAEAEPAPDAEGTAPAEETVEPEPPAEETPAVEAPPAPVLAGGTLSVSGLTLTPAGPRFDLSGTASLSVAGASLTGPLSGRFSLAEPGADGRRRLEGVVTVTVNGAAVEIRVAGHATPLDGDAETPATSFSFSGQFRTNGGATVSLVERGNVSGAFAPGSLSLNLTP